MTSKRKNPCTNWFPGSVKPVRVGVYKRLSNYATGFCYNTKVHYSYWDGRKWALAGESVVDAMTMTSAQSSSQSRPWCGLANDPEKNK